MNQVGKNFRSLTAIISQKKYVALLKEFEPEETGTLYYGRAKDSSARIRREIARPNRSILIVDAGKATVYEPRINQVRNVNLGKYKDKAEFLAVGIGQSPTKLEETFDIKLLGQEEINGKKTHVLELKPKSVETSAIFTKIILWIDDDRGMPSQQKFIEPSDDFLLIRFSSMRLNAKIPESAFRIKLPKDVEIINQ